LGWLCCSLQVCAEPTSLDFNRDVRPILSENCFACHGFDAHGRQADLRLDVADAAYADRDGVRAIAPGDLAASEAWRRINSSDESEVMPPRASHRELSEQQKATLQQWIEQGAPYAIHWSFIPPAKSPAPQVSGEAWARNEIDRFVLAALDRERLKPSAEADRRTLIRRLWLDLTGLPPSAEEVEAFAADRDERAYERLVDRLLASPHFGERMALDWLDAARYADTNGFSIDGGRHMWLWRDWVIDAFNRNTPYNEFLREQLAGDLLPQPTESQLIATGFQRNNMVTHEGGTIPEENLTNYNVDRVKTLGESVLGLTLGCCQCHDHKYDPITQRDYYRMFAFFNTLSDVGLDGNSGVNPRPQIMAKTVLPTDELPDLERQIAAVRKLLANPAPAEVTAWEEEQRRALALRGRGFAAHPVQLLKVSTPNSGAGFDVDAGRFVKIARGTDLVAYDVSLKLPPIAEPITALRVVFYPVETAPGGGWGFGHLPSIAQAVADAGKNTAPADKGTFVLTSFSASAESVPGDQVNLNRLLAFGRVTADSWLEAYPPEMVLDTRNENGWSPELSHVGTTHVTASLVEPIDAGATPFVAAQVNFGHRHNLIGARFEIQAITGIDDGSTLPQDVIEILGIAAEERSVAQVERVKAYFAAHAEPTERLRIELANLEERRQVLTERFPTMVMEESPTPRETHMLNRGDYSQPGEKVTAGTPGVLPPLPNGAPANRLGLAEWITMPGHPLTARVAVNRFWQLLFGAGLVKTTADFGSQGEWPSHPELLDWLAVDFIESGWDVKALVKKMVMSATYRQASTATPEMLAHDPGNRLLARGPRRRLAAEEIRDSALATSGLLAPRIGGPSVNPYTPGDPWREISHYGSTPATAQTFVQDHGEKLYRRSLYTYWKRTAPPPNMAAFDAPNREICTVQRPSTNTPLQALVLLNDVQFVEAARAFAQRILQRDGDDASRLRWGFVQCVSRPPSDAELAVLQGALARERRRYASDEAAARAFLAVGESLRDERIPAAEHAAWAQAASLILNLSEAVTRN